MKQPEPVTHEDLWQEIRKVERDLTRRMIAAASAMILTGFGAFAAVWQDSAQSAQIVGSVAAQVQNNARAVELAIESQRRVESGLSEINRYLREDGREQRESLQQHIRTGHPGASGR